MLFTLFLPSYFPLVNFESPSILQPPKDDPYHTGPERSGLFSSSYRKDRKMIYERDPESPFSKILVKNNSSVVDTIRRNLITGYYNFYDNQRGALNCLLQEKRIDAMKMRIEELFDLQKAS
jgi:hypothetical protein